MMKLSGRQGLRLCCCLMLAYPSFAMDQQRVYFDNDLEPALTNIRQVTFPSMGFEKAGEGYFSPDGRKIIFQAVPKGQEHYQIFTMDLAEGLPRMVSTGKGACTCPFFHPTNHNKILFASSHSDPSLGEIGHAQNVPGYQRQGGNYKWDFTPYMNIYEADCDGSNLHALTTGEAYHAECSYSHDGKSIVYVSNERGCMDVYTMAADGSQVKQITEGEWRYSGGPFFSPDGTRIIYRADYDKPDYLQLYIINSDGSNACQLFKDDFVNWAPFWHPNNRVIAYTTSVHGHHRYEIYLLNIQTYQRQRLTNSPGFDGLPAFSPDGRKLLWTSKRGLDQTSQLFIADFTLPENIQ